MTPQRLDLLWFFMEVTVELRKLHHHPATLSTQGASISSRIQVTGSQGLPTDLRKISKVPPWSVCFLRKISRSPNSWLKIWKVSSYDIIRHVLWWVVTKQFEWLLQKIYPMNERIMYLLYITGRDDLSTQHATGRVITHQKNWVAKKKNSTTLHALHRLVDRDPYSMAKNINPIVAG